MKNKDCIVIKLIVGTLLLLLANPLRSQQGQTRVEGTVYTQSGAPATGSVQLNWPAFTTASGQSVPQGSTTVPLGAGGSLSVALMPNAGASAQGAHYSVTYVLGDGTQRTEQWSVPAADLVALAQVVVPPSDTVHVASVGNTGSGQVAAPLDLPESLFLLLAGGTMTGPLVLNADPTSSLQAATKNYVDSSVTAATGSVLPLSGGAVSGTLGAANLMTKLPRVDVRSQDFAGGADPKGVQDSLAAITAAIAFAKASASSSDASYPSIYLPPGHYKVNGTIRLPNNMHLIGDSKANTILQETGAAANLITIYDAHSCSVYSCYGGVDGITLEGKGKATTGTLLEIDTGNLILRDLHFFNSGGRGLQMNGPAERIVGHNLSFYDIRWPMVLAGDTNENYFYNTHIIEAGETRDSSGSPTWFNQWCYSVNCVNGVFNAPGTQANPTVLYPDPHGSIHIDKAVNVTFIGGSIKSTGVLSGVRVWNGDLVKFENLYHEDVYGGNIPRTNRAYILGGKAEQTYFTGTLTGTGLVVAVADPSWMPQYFGNPADVTVSAGDYYGYVILPQDYNRASTAPSAYAPGVQQNQYELITINGFASDGNLYIGGRNLGGSTAPAGTQWPAGSVIEQYSGPFGFAGPVEFNNIHLNQVQGPLAVGGYQVGCNQQNVNFCGEIVAGYAPDLQAPSSNPATNQIGFYAPLGDPNDPVPSAGVDFNMRSMDMGSNSSNPYVGQIATHHWVTMQIYGASYPEKTESTAAVSGTAAGKQLSLASATGGSNVTAPLYSTGLVAGVEVTMPNAGTFWDSARGIMTKYGAVFGRYQQYGAYMTGMQYQNLYCLFDTPTVDGGHVANRFCTGGGPSNTTAGGPGYGPGIEYDSWNGTSWTSLFRVSGAGGTGAVTTGPLTSASVTSSAGVTGTKVTFAGTGSTLSNTPVMVWSPWGGCSTMYVGCGESGAPLNLIYPVVIQGWTMTLINTPAGCTNAGTLQLLNGSTVVASVNLANGVGTYTATIQSAARQIAAGSALGIKVTTAATGCTTYGGGFNTNVTYSMQ